MKTVLRWVFIVVVSVGVLVSLFYAEEDWRGWHAWQKFKREWEAKGEKFDLATIVPPTVPDDQNFAFTPIAFTSYGNMLTRDGKAIPYEQRDADFVNRLKMPMDFNGGGPTNAIGNWQKGSKSDLQAWQNYYRTLAAITNIFPASPRLQTPAQDVLLALSKYDSAIEELREAGRLPYARFPLEYDKDDPAAILLPHLASLKGVTQTLRLRAIAELQNGQTEKALDDVKLSLRLADSIRNEPFLISHLVRIAILNIVLQPIYEGLEEHKWSDAQLVILNLELSKLDFLADYKLAMHGEMGFQDGIVRYLRHRSGQYLNLMGDAGNYGNMSATEFMVATAMHWHLVPSGWFYQNQLHCARAMEEFYLPVADVNQQTFIPALISQADASVEKERKSPSPFNILECLMLPNLGKAAKNFSHTQSSVDLARVAIALERYRLAHDEYPETLDALTPQFIETLPHDIINGQPLHYRRETNERFILYSVGWNETDDGGQIVLSKNGTVDRENGDWVWQYPLK